MSERFRVRLAIVLAGCTGCHDPDAQPDIVLIVVDTLRADHLGVYGSPRDTSPAIDALAAEGGWWAEAYAQSGWTLPSIASLLTGMYVHEHRAGRFPERHSEADRGAPRGLLRELRPLDSSFVTLAEDLRAVGYATAGFVNNPFFAPSFGLSQGFDAWDASPAANAHHRSAGDTARAAVDWLRTAPKPRFCLIHFMEPHADYDAPPPRRGMFAGEPPLGFAANVPGEVFTAMQRGLYTPDDPGKEWVRGRYDEEVRTVDDGTKTARDGLPDPSNTVLVFTADHGEEHWEHGRFEHGHALWSELTHVPLVALGPHIPRGRHPGVVEHVDMFRTLVAIAGGIVPQGTHGVDLRTSAGPGTALSENCLYGPECAPVTNGSTRISLNPVTSALDAWTVVGGHERSQVGPPSELLQLLSERLRSQKPLTPTAAPPSPAGRDAPGPPRPSSGAGPRTPGRP